MIRRRTMAMGLAMIFCSSAFARVLAADRPAAGRDGSDSSGAASDPAVEGALAVQKFLVELYDHYIRAKGEAKGVVLDGEADLRRWFDPSLVALVLKDRAQAAKRGAVPKLDGDPFVDAQEWEIDAVEVEVEPLQDENRAEATVSFDNAGQPTSIELLLVRVAGAWRISDIFWEEGSLREVLLDE